MQNPFHEGERKVQRIAGEERMADRNGVMIAERIMGAARPFLAEQSMAVFASRDAEGRLWASMLFGSRGFMRSPDGKTVDLDLTQMAVQNEDPFWRNIAVNPAVGMLAIDLATRRRIRINGDIRPASEKRLQLSVKESFPNCPKYITRRTVRAIEALDAPAEHADAGTLLAPKDRELLERADVLFVGTAHPTRGADVSHRGGNPGFIQVLDEATLRIPDYPGNSMFNTLGNLAVDPAAGLVVPDFEHGRSLLLTGRAEIVFNGDDPGDATGGTNRFLLFRIEERLRLPLPAALKAELLDYSPFNP
jgi:predicted pyridoxine 5'-phosphate oxidase superfamily flavin-nucleotide-binding protein